MSSALAGSTTWTTPAMIGTGTFPEVAMSTSGAGFILYGRYVGGTYPTQAMVRTGGVWSAPVTLDSGGGSSWHRAIAADAAGNALAVWDNSGIRASVYRAGIGWQPTTTINSGGGGDSPKVAMNEAGRGVAGWCDGGKVFAASYEPATGWGAPHGTSRTDCCSAGSDLISPGVGVAMSELGQAYAFGASGTACVVSLSPGGSWSWSTLSDSGILIAPQVAASADGHVIATWMNVSSGTRTLKAQAYAPGVGWGPLLTGPTGLGAGPIGVGYGSGGYAAIMFKLHPSLRYVTYDAASGTLSAPVAFSPAGAVPYYLRSAANPLEPSQGVTVWQQNGSEEIWGARVGL